MIPSKAPHLLEESYGSQSIYPCSKWVNSRIVGPLQILNSSLSHTLGLMLMKSPNNGLQNNGMSLTLFIKSNNIPPCCHFQGPRKKISTNKK